MSLPYGTEEMQTAQRTRYDIWFPFWNEGDTSTRMVEEEWVQDAGYYFPLSLGSGHPQIANCYLVEERRPERIDGGLYKWVRVYSQVPQPRREYQSYGWTRFGYSSGGSLVTIATDPSFTENYP